MRFVQPEPAPTEGIQTKAWYQFGGLKGAEPGYLVLTPDKRLIFVGWDGSRFDAPLSAVTDVKFPRHWFDGGCKLTIAGQEHRVDFVRPNGAPDPSGRLGEFGFGANAFGVAADVVEVGLPRPRSFDQEASDEFHRCARRIRDRIFGERAARAA